MLFKRPGSDYWQIKFTLNGRTVRRSSQTNDKRLAERIEHAARQSIIKDMVNGVTEVPSFTWEQAVKLWITEKDAKRSIDSDYAIFKSLKPYFSGVECRDITALAIAKYRTIMVQRASASTANRHLALMRAVLRRLEVLEIIDKAPHIDLLPIEIKEPVWVSPEQIQAVLDALPDYARDIAEFAVLTGLRRGNVLGLLWQWVKPADQVVIIPAAQMKAGKTLVVPLTEPSLAVLERRVGVHKEYVFTGPDGSNRLDTIKRPWATAVAKAGVSHLRFHDLRHAWASFHTMNQTPDRVLQALGGWSSNKMVQRYGHLKPDALAQYAGNARLK